MRTIKTYSKGAPFYNAFRRTWGLAAALFAISSEWGGQFFMFRPIMFE
jgi:hypothetical protein